jgi:hypothetical protein
LFRYLKVLAMPQVWRLTGRNLAPIGSINTDKLEWLARYNWQ